jgi:hypothetical protein
MDRHAGGVGNSMDITIECCPGGQHERPHYIGRREEGATCGTVYQRKLCPAFAQPADGLGQILCAIASDHFHLARLKRARDSDLACRRMNSQPLHDLKTTRCAPYCEVSQRDQSASGHTDRRFG